MTKRALVFLISYGLFPPVFGLNDREQQLFDAMEAENIASVKELIGQGVNISAKNSQGDTPLHIAVRKGNFDIVQLLGKYRANVNAQDHVGMTPLMHAVEKSEEIVTYLIKIGANVNARDHEGRTPLMHSGGIFAYSEILINAKAQIKTTDKCGLTVLSHLGFHEGASGIYDSLLQIGLKPTPNDRLLAACRDVSLEAAKEALSSGAKSNKSCSGTTPLHWAMANVSSESRAEALQLIKLLIHAGANVNAKDESGLTPLMALLAGRGNNLNWTVDMRPDMKADKRDELVTIIRWCLKANYDLDAKDKSGRTTLQIAKENFNEDEEGIFRLLTSTH